MSSTSNDCAVLAASNGGHIQMTSCRNAQRAGDGRATFRATGTGQLRVVLGGYCVFAKANGLAVQDCNSAGQSETAADKFFFIAVPEFDPTFADAARQSAQLALNSAERLEGLLGRLNEAVPMLASCTLGHSLARHDQPHTALS